MGEAAALLAAALLEALSRRPARRVREAREVAEGARAAEGDRRVRSAADLASATGCSVRTLQRLYASHVGVSPTWVIRRFRIIDAAERVQAREPVSWAALAAELGYSDQAHLTRDFTATLGTTPAAYARAERA